MPVTFRIDSRQEIVFSKAEGVISDQQLLEHHRALRAHSEFRPHFRQLYDYRDAIDADVAKDRLTPEALYDLAINNPFSESSRRAFLARTPLQYGLLRMFIGMCNQAGESMKIFEDRDEALRWLDSQATDD